jgi:hypothetical protein
MGGAKAVQAVRHFKSFQIVRTVNGLGRRAPAE